MAYETPLTLLLGDPARGGAARTEDFLDGRLRIQSRDGLYPSERAVLPLLPQGKTGRALVIDSRYAVLGFALRVLNPELEVHLHYDDAWHGDRAKEMLERHPDDKLSVAVEADPPEGPWQFVVYPLERQGIADMVRERIRLAAARWLAPGGLLYSSSDTRDDRFVRDEIKKAFGSLHIAPEERRSGGVGYVARRPGKALVAPPRSATSFEVQEEGQTLTFQSRLGVFCSDRLDPGSRALLALADVSGAKRILDLGSGSGVVGIVAARRAPGAHVVFLDSSAQAADATRRNLEAHGLTDRAEVVLSADPPAALGEMPKFDLVLTNPPYYGNWRIAELFLETIRQVLEPGGRLILVTKGADWYRTQLKDGFERVREETRGGYVVFTAVRRRGR